MQRKGLMLLLLLMLTAALNIAMAQELKVSDIKNSGCLNDTRGEETETVPTIILTKEGSELSVQLLNYESNCGTTGFNVTSNVSEGDPCTVNVYVSAIVYADMDCVCPYDVSFTVCDLEPNSFYLNCWWFNGVVHLTDGKSLVLENKKEYAVIDGLGFRLLKAMHTAALADAGSCEGEVIIPGIVSYMGEDYEVTEMDMRSFLDNTKLTKVRIPRTISAKSFWSNPFMGCTALESIEVEEGNPDIYAVDGVLFKKHDLGVLSYPIGSPRTSYTIPNGVKCVYGQAFAYSPYLERVIVPDEVTSLGYSAFTDCKNLLEVKMPKSLRGVASNLFFNCQRLKSIEIPNGVTYLGNDAFNGCSSLISVVIPESVKEADSYVFAGCKSLKSVVISSNLKMVSFGMFDNCSNLTDVKIPEGVPAISNYAFRNCSSLRTLDLPESLTCIATAFVGTKMNTLCIRGILQPNCMTRTVFSNMSTQTKLYVQPSEVEKFKVIYSGPVYPLEQADKIENIEHEPLTIEHSVYDLQGRRITGNPSRGLYIINGGKVLLK